MDESDTLKLFVADATGMDALGACLAQAIGRRGLIVGLSGELGTGKSTFARGFLKATGVRGAIPSPTYALIEPYESDGLTVLHVDLYRIEKPADVQPLGLDALLGDDAIALIEWPERAAGVIGLDIRVGFTYRRPGRAVTIEPFSPAGRAVLDAMAAIAD